MKVLTSIWQPNAPDWPWKRVFLFFWLLTCTIYLPTIKAGWVIDASGMLYNMAHQPLWYFLNNAQASAQSFYHFCALNYVLLFQVFGRHFWLWGLFCLTLHAVNATLLFTLCRAIARDAGISSTQLPLLAGIVLFTVSPQISEVLVWRACIHYLEAFMFVLLCLHWLRRYQHTPRLAYPLVAAGVFAVSLFSLELFYLVPFFILSLMLFYRFVLHYPVVVFRKSLLYFLLPHLLLFGCHFLALKLRYGNIKPHVNNVFTQTAADYLSKPLKLLYHIVFLGRYHPIPVKEYVYGLCHSTGFLAFAYCVVVAVAAWLIISWRRLGTPALFRVLILLWGLATLAFLMPLPFPNAALLVFYDRYTYFTSSFLFIVAALLAARYLPRYAALSLFAGFAAISLFFTIRVNTYWKHAAYTTTRLITSLPPLGSKTVLMLNVPENLNGVAMIGAQPEGQFKAMHEVYTGNTIPNSVYEVASYNMINTDDGAHVDVENDSTLVVTLNQWGTWWWYGGQGAVSYSNEAYKVDMVDAGHWYRLTLKQPSSSYLILFVAGNQWQTVNMHPNENKQ